jgi:cytochrome P450
VDPHKGKAPSRERLLAEVGNQIMAPETAAHTISWVLYCLATHPAVEARLLAELREAGLPCNGDLEAAVAVLSSSFDPLRELPFLSAVINEAQRLYPAGASASPRYVHALLGCHRRMGCAPGCACGVALGHTSLQSSTCRTQNQC